MEDINAMYLAVVARADELEAEALAKGEPESNLLWIDMLVKAAMEAAP